MHTQKDSSRGFTLIELLVVVSIIGLLSTLAVLALGTARTKARDSSRVANIANIRGALELYYLQANSYPSDGGSPLALGSGTALCLTDVGFEATCTGSSLYMQGVPRDPSKSGAASVCTDASTAVCDYAFVSTGTSYTIKFYLESGTGGLPTGVRTASPGGTI
ncbi:MAG: prepilin-type N-terminal cleavage/methylation domain-containing protein [Parcubacteria group bacterium]|nr:prepilin-type N-terminal cleavage/methylation domain-containing protein [Parcubacteria group bacterium]